MWCRKFTFWQIWKQFRLLMIIALVTLPFLIVTTSSNKTAGHRFQNLNLINDNNSVSNTMGLMSNKRESHTPLRMTDKSTISYTLEKLFFETRKHVKEVNCRSICDGDELEIKKAKSISKMFFNYVITPQQYIHMTKNCSKFIKKRGYITDPLTEEEKNFPIAFDVLMYADIEQTERLLRAIYRPQNIYCIHVDLKANNEIYEAVLRIANCFENVFTSRRIDVTYGFFTTLEPDINCMHELWNRSKLWKYFINLTGQEFPLKTNYEIVQILKAYNGSNDIMTGHWRRGEQTKRLTDAGKTPHDIVPVKGSVHIVVSRGYVDYVLHDDRARDLLQWSRYVRCPVEVFFASLHENYFLKVPGSINRNHSHTVRSAVRYKNWSGSCRGKSVRGICILGIGDLPVLATRFELFANKFHLNYDPLGFDCIEELNFNRTRDQFMGNFNFDASRYSKGGFLAND